MGYHKSANIAEIINQIRATSYECADTRTDGWTGLGLKQDLHQIKWAIDEALRRCPTFVGEDEWLHEQEKKRLIEILKK